ncbi:hypothetical protein QQZ08_008744 [Neonectria magnoliae]|uniref:Uncharacterized protein n=1 Tax=Neonectria magnoliae TaxID=2732573 RepID=A0ABR1HSE4_9HYPO
MPSNPGMFRTTTTGVLVQDDVGNEFMAVAAQGFPGACGTNVTPAHLTSGRKVGELTYEVSHTDVGMVKLEPHERFANVTFKSDDITEPVRLKQLLRAEMLKSGDSVVLDSPDTGRINGTFQAQGYQRAPTVDANETEQQWVSTAWYYMGKGFGTNLDVGMCGSAI